MRSLVFLAALAAGCAGAIRDRDRASPDAGDESNDALAGSSGASGSAGAGTAGTKASALDDEAEGPRFACTAPETRGQGALAIRRLTRDELLDSFAAVLGEDVMQASAVLSAAAQIPGEAPGDLVATFQNGHAYDHAAGLLLAAQAIAVEVMGDDAARERVLGDCAQEADRACAEAFLDAMALRILRRPLPSARRAALLTAFEAEGASSAGMQWLLTRLLQAPESVFHLELPRQACEASAASDLSFGWDDESVFFAPLGAEETGPQAELTQNGWYVWQILGERIASGASELQIALEARASDGAALELDVNLNDMPLLHGLSLEPGEHVLSADVAIEAGSNVKVGVYFKNAAEGRALAPRELTLIGQAEVETCSDLPAEEGVLVLDDFSVASRLAYALTGQGPDDALLDAALAGELRTEADVRPHAERLVQTAAARRQLARVLEAWLELHAIPSPHAVITERAGIEGAGLADEARAELLEYARYQILDQEADVASLMSDAIGFPRSERMATLYGSEVAEGEDPVALPDGHGGMLLRIAPLLSGQLRSSPILRGVYVRKRILCDSLPSPDFSIVNSRLEELEHQDRTQVSTREAVTEITSEGACPACHQHINPIGFTLERFDPLGMPRSEEIVLDQAGNELARHPIDARVTDANLEPGLPMELDGAEALNVALAQSAKVRACIAERLYTHAQLRPASAEDHCALAVVETALREGLSVKEAWLRAVTGPELFVRKATDEELEP